MARSEEVVVEVAGREVRVTSPEKVFFTARPDTKLDLVRYYQAVEQPFMDVARGRPALMQRFPDGAAGKSFFQKRVPAGAPPWLQTTMVTTPNGTTSNALVLADMAHVVWAVNLGCLGFHVWPTHWDDMDHADELRIDLDPSPGVNFEMIREAASRTRGSWPSWGSPASRRPPATAASTSTCAWSGAGTPTTSASPRWRWPVSSSAAGATSSPRRGGRRSAGPRVFIDFNQNAPHKTVFGAWSVRARPMASVSAPLLWEELDHLVPDDLTIVTVPERLARQGDPWAEMYDHRSRSSRCSSCTSRTGPPGSRTRRGRPSTRRCPTRRPA